MTEKIPTVTAPPTAEHIARRVSRRQGGIAICGYIDGDSVSSVTCSDGGICATGLGGSVVGCYTSGSDFFPPTTCIDQSTTCDNSACLSNPSNLNCNSNAAAPWCQMGLFMGNYLHTPYGFECGTTPEVVTIWPSATDGGPVANALTGFGTGSAGSSNLDVTSDTGGPTISNITPPTGVATSLGSNPTGSSTSGTANPSSAGLTAGDIAGLAVGSFVGLALLVLIIIGSVFLYRRRHPRPPPVPSSQWGNSQLLDQPMSAPSSTGLSSWISSAPVDPHDSISQVGQPSSAQTSTQSTGPQPTPSFHQHPQGALPPAPSQFGSIPPYYNPSVTL